MRRRTAGEIMRVSTTTFISVRVNAKLTDDATDDDGQHCTPEAYHWSGKEISINIAMNATSFPHPADTYIPAHSLSKHQR
jgi:hypothetical protein